MSPTTSVSPSSRAAPHQVTYPQVLPQRRLGCCSPDPQEEFSCPRPANEGGLMVLQSSSLGRHLRSKEIETKKIFFQLLIEIADSEDS